MPKASCRASSQAFSLIEVLVSAVVVAVLLLILLGVSNQVLSIWQHTSGKMEQFRQSREAFDRISRRLSQATLNTYWDYDNPAAPARYVRQSELRFLSGPMEQLAGAGASGQHPTHGIFFQTPLGISQPGQTQLAGLNSLLNTWGYFIEFGSNADFRPGLLASTSVAPTHRFRLCELIQPADSLSLYSYTSGKNADGTPKSSTYTGRDWFRSAVDSQGATRPVHVLAENVIALILQPQLSTQADPSGTRLAPDYSYDSTHTRGDPAINPKNQLPPQVVLTLVALDETSAKRLENGSTMPSLGLDRLFLDAANYEADLEELKKTLISQNLDFRVFTTTVSLRESRWSSNQAN